MGASDLVQQPQGQVTTLTFHWCLKWWVGRVVLVGEVGGQSYRTGPLTYRIWILDDLGRQWLEARF